MFLRTNSNVSDVAARSRSLTRGVAQGVAHAAAHGAARPLSLAAAKAARRSEGLRSGLRAPVIFGAFALAGLLLSSAGCDSCSGGSKSASSELPPAAATYTSRGKAVHVPSGTRPGEKIVIHHEAIPHFKDRKDEVVGMESMQMSFELSEAKLSEGLRPGQPVRFTFEVRWEGDVPLRVIAVEALPDNTELTLATMPQMH